MPSAPATPRPQREQQQDKTTSQPFFFFGVLECINPPCWIRKKKRKRNTCTVLRYPNHRRTKNPNPNPNESFPVRIAISNGTSSGGTTKRRQQNLYTTLYRVLPCLRIRHATMSTKTIKNESQRFRGSFCVLEVRCPMYYLVCAPIRGVLLWAVEV